ncbi:MAG: hypothetical protein JSV81_03060 [Anaerolineales bacterium]|nr:MAG: hypothetical protein JSV81_03060 [Anaerolineales bacterium]
MKMLSWIAILLGGVAAGVMAGLLLSTEQRLRLSQQLAATIGGMAEQMPDG